MNRLFTRTWIPRNKRQYELLLASIVLMLTRPREKVDRDHNGPSTDRFPVSKLTHSHVSQYNLGMAIL